MTRILVVEDEPLIAADIAATLEELGFEVAAIAYSMGEALSQFEQIRPDLITLDVNLGLGDEGFEIARFVRDQGPAPIVVLTGHSDRKTLDFFQAMDRVTVVLKPINATALDRAVRGVLAA